jgi:hypothetical protein
MIPKIIHACWLGSAKMPEEQVKYIEGWKKLHPDYEIKIWTDETFSKYYDDSNFVKEAIKRNKYGFLSDYFRFTVLYEFGGIYVDTDVEMFKPLDEFLDSKMFMGYIFDTSIGTALFGTEPKNPLMLEWKKILEEDFDKKKDFTVSNDWITKYFIDNFKDFRLTGRRQSLSCGIEVYPKDYFERYKLSKKTPGGYAEHHCYGSWNDDKQPLIRRILKKILPRKIISYFGHLKKIRQTPYYNVYLKHKKETKKC